MPVVCSICLEAKEPAQIQKLPCTHVFCKDCIPKCTSTQLCPALYCSYVRHVNVVIDEADEGNDEETNIQFGQKLPSMLQLEERLRCDGRKGSFACVNSARMTLLDCRHHLCYDCLTSRINVAFVAQEVPYCPIFRCANRLTKSEIAKIAERTPHMRSICAKMIEISPEDTPEEHAGKDECVLFCSVYQAENTTKPITFPLACTIIDMVSAMIQVQRLKKNRTAHNIDIYMRTHSGGKPKYEPIDVKAMAKKKISEIDFRDRTHFILDVDNELRSKIHK